MINDLNHILCSIKKIVVIIVIKNLQNCLWSYRNCSIWITRKYSCFWSMFKFFFTSTLSKFHVNGPTSLSWATIRYWKGVSIEWDSLLCKGRGRVIFVRNFSLFFGGELYLYATFPSSFFGFTKRLFLQFDPMIFRLQRNNLIITTTACLQTMTFTSL